ncbi:MAG: hypothetical protein AAF573_22970 [Bacteroidota bacterium]
MKKIIITFLLFFGGSAALLAQAYRTVGGLRLGTGTGSGIALSLVQKVGKRSTIEGIFQPSFNNGFASADLLYKQHNKILFKRFNIYSGAGLHQEWRPKDDENASKAHTGFSGIVGGEITFKKWNVSWDYLPSVNVLGGDTKFRHQSAVTLRMVIVPKKKKKIHWKFWKKKKTKKEIRRERRAKKKKKSKAAEKPWWKVWEK